MTDEEIGACFEALGRGDFDPLVRRLADDVVLEFPGRRFGGRFEGSRKVAIFLKRNQRMFRDGLQFTVSWAGSAGDRAIAQWTNEGVTREGTPYANRGVTVMRLEGDKIVEIQDYLDTETLDETWPA